MLQRLKRSQALTHVAQLLTGTALAQAIPILVSPVLTRLYTPHSFGELGIFSALLLGLSLVVSGRFEVAVPIPADDGDAFELMALSVAVTIASVAVLTLAAAVVAFAAMPRHALGLAQRAVLMLPLGILFAAAQQSFAYWLTRARRYPVIARARVAQGGVTAVASIALGMARVPDGLVLSLVLGYATAFVILCVASRSEIRRVRSLSITALRAVARRYAEFPTLNTANALLDTARDSGTLIIFSALFGVGATGLLSQTMRVTRAPMSLIGQAVAQVFYQRVSHAHAQGQAISRHVRSTLLGLAFIAIPIYVVVFFFGPSVFALVFGEQWRQAGEYARLLAPWLALSFVLSPVSLLPVIAGRQPTALKLNCLDTTARLAALVIGQRIAGVPGALIGYATLGLAVGVVQLWWYVRLGRSQGLQMRKAA